MHNRKQRTFGYCSNPECWHIINPATAEGWKGTCTYAWKDCKCQCDHCIPGYEKDKRASIEKEYVLGSRSAIAYGGLDILQKLTLLALSKQLDDEGCVLSPADDVRVCADKDYLLEELEAYYDAGIIWLCSG